VNWRFWRHLLIVLGAYFLAMSLLPVIMQAHMLAHVGVSYSDNILSEVFAVLIEEFPRALTGALAMVLIWYAIGPALARRWMWALAGLFTFFALMTAINKRFSPHPDYIWMAVQALLPGVACVLTGLGLQRVAQGGPGEEAVRDEPTPQPGRTVALVIACSAIAMITGGIITTVTFMSLMSAPCR
jgi:hypothetical protein